MAFSQGSRSGLSYVTESTFGVTPGSPALVQIPYNTHSLEMTKDRVSGNDIQPDRMLRVDRHGNRQAGGDIVVDLRKGDFDPFLESALMGAFADPATLATVTATSSAGTATITFASQPTPPFPVGSIVTVNGVTPAGFNGAYTVTACTQTSVSFANATSGPQTVAGTVSSAISTTATAGAGGTATLTFAAQPTPPFPVGSAITVAGVTPTGYNGTYTVTACTTTTVSYLNATTGSQTVAGTIKNRALKVGTAPKSFSIEDAAADIAQFRLFTGMTVNTLAVSIKPNSMIAATFSMVGKDMTISGTSLDPTKDASSANQPFDAYSGAMAIGNAGAALSSVAIITGIDFSITNALAPTFVIGSASTPQLEFGMATVEGTITAYFEDATLINRFVNETTSAFQVTVNDPSGASNYTFHFPRVKINGASVPVDGPTSRIVTLPFVALYDPIENTNIEIIRNPTA